MYKYWTYLVQVILFEIDCAIFYTNLHKLFCQFISWTNWVNSGEFMDNCWISCQVMADMKKDYDHLMIINLYLPCFCNVGRSSTCIEIVSYSGTFYYSNSHQKYNYFLKFVKFLVGYLRFWTQVAFWENIDFNIYLASAMWVGLRPA